jgi:hypothetical protein
MTTAQALLIFDVLQDQYGAPYFPEDWKLKLLNMAQLEVLNRMVPDTLGGSANFELDQNTYENIVQLIWDVSISVSDFIVVGDSASIERSLVVTTLRNTVGVDDASAEIFRILNVGILDSTIPFKLTPIKYTKQNNILTYMNNVFKVPSTSDYRYTYSATHFHIIPLPGDLIRFQLIKTPRIMTALNSPNWNDYMMNQVILQALKLAGIAVSDTAEIQNVINSGIQSGQ